ncbi:MAG: ATP synthase F1 subunit epsilon [Bryobacteraceae bacterium]
MPSTFLLEIATPERLLVREQVTEAQIPAAEGYIGVLPEHAPLLGEMGIGELSYVAGGRRRDVVVDGGWVEVLPDHVRVLTRRAEHADEIDLARARKSLDRARERLTAPGIDVARAFNAMKRAQARLAAAERK